MLSEYTALADFCEQSGEPMRASYTVKGLADLLCLSKHAIYDAIYDGSLRAFLPRGREKGIRIRAAEVNRWIEEEW